MVVLHTSFGDIYITLHSENAPKTVANFIAYVKEGHFNGTIFHRVINGFMVQGGGFNSDMIEINTKDSIKNEANNGLKNIKGTIAMARTTDPHSASSQFFINVSDNNFLNHTSETPEGWGYAVFGEISEGMDVIDKIKAVKTTSRNGHDDVPIENITIESVDLS